MFVYPPPMPIINMQNNTIFHRWFTAGMKNGTEKFLRSTSKKPGRPVLSFVLEKLRNKRKKKKVGRSNSPLAGMRAVSSSRDVHHCSDYIINMYKGFNKTYLPDVAKVIHSKNVGCNFFLLKTTKWNLSHIEYHWLKRFIRPPPKLQTRYTVLPLNHLGVVI